MSTRIRSFLLFTLLLSVLPTLHGAAASPNSITSPATADPGYDNDCFILQP